MYRTITEILDIARKDKWDLNRLKAEISYYLRKNDLTKRDAEQVKEQYARVFEFIQGSTIIDTEGFSRAINQFGSQFAKSKTGVNEKIMAAVNKHWIDLDHTTLRKEIAHQLGALRHYSETIRRTAITGMQSAVSVEKAVKDGVKKFKYIGPPAERGFCKLHLNKSYTIDEIKQMSNGMGLDVFTYRGGWNCRHKWVPDAKAENQIQQEQGQEIPLSDFNAELYNQYLKQDVGEYYYDDKGFRYIKESVTKDGKRFKYTPDLMQPSKLSSILKSTQQEAERRSINNQYHTFFDTKESIKQINKAVGGKIEGKSKTTSSIYSETKDGVKIRVSDHPAFADRSSSDIYVEISQIGVEIAGFDKDGEEIIETLYYPKEFTLDNMDELYKLIAKRIKIVFFK